MRLVTLAACWLVGCSFAGALPDDTTGGAPDAGGDCISFSTVIDTCALPPGASLIIEGSRRYDTDTGVLSDDPGMANASMPAHVVVAGAEGNIDVLVVDRLTIVSGARLRVVGTLPLAIAATGDVDIIGALDASAGGAGARDAAACGAAAGGSGQDGGGGGSGGGGGAFHGEGGRGGDGNGNANGGHGVLSGAIGGIAIPIPDGLRGGCPGGDGGQGDGNIGRGGSGGGGVFVVSATSVVVGDRGEITAGGGGGGRGLSDDDAGAGGGAGGMILLEAPVLTISGVLAANGGSGGGGSVGQPGENGLASAMAAPGGAGGVFGTPGGNGGALGGTENGISVLTLNDGGGGGGGGGVGVIALMGTSPSITGTISPARSTWPPP